jgi:F1F0 ATPase subunit 2
MLNNASWILVCIAALLAGGALGAMFFAGLWWTVRRAAASSTPARWFLGSLVLRTAMVLAGFYALGAGHPERLGLGMLGFLLARTIVLRTTGPSSAALTPPARHTPGAPPCA